MTLAVESFLQKSNSQLDCYTLLNFKHSFHHIFVKGVREFVQNCFCGKADLAAYKGLTLLLIKF